MVKLLLLEGVCGAGKSTVSKALQKIGGEHEVVLLGQNFTYAPIAPAEDTGLLDNETNARFLGKQIAYLKTLLDTGDEKDRIVVLDTFHITQMIRPGVLSSDNFRIVDAALAELDCRMAFLWIDEETLMQRTIVERRGTGFARYVTKFGDSDNEVWEHFCQEQQDMWLVASEVSEMPVRRLDGSNSIAILAEALLSFVLS